MPLTNPIHVHITFNDDMEGDRPAVVTTVEEGLAYSRAFEDYEASASEANTNRREYGWWNKGLADASSLIHKRAATACAPDTWPGARFETDLVPYTWQSYRPGANPARKFIRATATTVRGQA